MFIYQWVLRAFKLKMYLGPVLLAFSLCTASARAQHISDVLVCMDSQYSVEKLHSYFASLSWEHITTQSAYENLRESASFLGNVNAKNPKEWNKIQAWATKISKSRTSAFNLYRWDDSWVEFGENSTGQRYCIVSSNVAFLSGIASRLTAQYILHQGPRLFLFYDKDNLRVSASEFPAQDRPKNLLKNKAVFTVTFVAKKES
jgi:hypothetical protein